MTVLVQFRDPILDVSGKVVGFYPREFYPLDNFSSFQVDWKGRRWQTAEHAYQGAKFLTIDPGVAEEIFAARSAHDAQKLATKYKDRRPKNWDDVKVGIMEDICRHKLIQQPYVWKKLLETCDLDIVEDSPKDDFWGWGLNRNGRNELGKIWMRLRQEARSGKIKSEEPKG